jgi:hypothetical protein
LSYKRSTASWYRLVASKQPSRLIIVVDTTDAGPSRSRDENSHHAPRRPRFNLAVTTVSIAATSPRSHVPRRGVLDDLT